MGSYWNSVPSSVGYIPPSVLSMKLTCSYVTTLYTSVKFPPRIDFFSVGSILFWTDWDASLPRIEAASMSGEGRRTIHRETGSGGWPNGLTVDYMERRIVWIDAR